MLGCIGSCLLIVVLVVGLGLFVGFGGCLWWLQLVVLASCCVFCSCLVFGGVLLVVALFCCL